MDTLIQSTPVATKTRLWPPQAPRERVTYSLIIGTGALCFVLLAWVHLGLGALVFPPAATAQQQVARAGNYSVTLQLDSGQLRAGGPNSLALHLRDAAGRPVSDATVRVQPVMTTMSMDVPAASAIALVAGTYIAHPTFGMAGPWRLDVSMTSPGGSTNTASFDVNVHWN